MNMNLASNEHDKSNNALKKGGRQNAEQLWQKINRASNENNQFLRKSWFDGWSMYFSGEKNRTGGINYGQFTDQSGNVAVLPHGRQKIGPFNFLSLAGDYFPRRGIPHTAVTNELVEKAASYLSEKSDICGVRFCPVIKTDPFICALTQELESKGWRFIFSSAGHDYGMAVPKDFDGYYAGLSKSRRKKTAYYRRKLEQAGNVVFKHHKNLSLAKWEKVIRDLERVESKAWVAKEGDSHFVGPDHQVFWQDLVQDDYFKKAINVWMIYIDENPVSFLFAIDIASERYVLASSYDDEVAKFRTGHHLELEMIRDTIEEEKVSYINNGLGNSGYKDAWGSTEYHELADICAFPPTVQGLFAYLVGRIRHFGSCLATCPHFFVPSYKL